MGAINYLSRIECMDLVGLGSPGIARHQRSGTLTTAMVREMASARGIRIAVVYPSFFEGKAAVPEEWITVGRWTIANNVVCGFPTVAFVAARESEVDLLRSNLSSFNGELPAGVVWEEVTSESRQRGVRANEPR
ncbi:MAG TPA: hypothetical protein VFT55_08270 [Planctomycetota bacterium]|nr:hypothetical protein [Planctomycetota bacterium]